MNLQIACRTCGGPGDPGVNLLDVAQQRILMWVDRNLSLQVNAHNGFPFMICIPCLESIKSWMLFRDRCNKAQRLFQNEVKCQISNLSNTEANPKINSIPEISQTDMIPLQNTSNSNDSSLNGKEDFQNVEVRSIVLRSKRKIDVYPDELMTFKRKKGRGRPSCHSNLSSLETSRNTEKSVELKASGDFISVHQNGISCFKEIKKENTSLNENTLEKKLTLSSIQNLCSPENKSMSSKKKEISCLESISVDNKRTPPIKRHMRANAQEIGISTQEKATYSNYKSSEDNPEGSENIVLCKKIKEEKKIPNKNTISCGKDAIFTLSDGTSKTVPQEEFLQHRKNKSVLKIVCERIENFPNIFSESQPKKESRLDSNESGKDAISTVSKGLSKTVPEEEFHQHGINKSVLKIVCERIENFPNIFSESQPKKESRLDSNESGKDAISTVSKGLSKTVPEEEFHQHGINKSVLKIVCERIENLPNIFSESQPKKESSFDSNKSIKDITSTVSDGASKTAPREECHQHGKNKSGLKIVCERVENSPNVVIKESKSKKESSFDFNESEKICIINKDAPSKSVQPQNSNESSNREIKSGGRGRGRGRKRGRPQLDKISTPGNVFQDKSLMLPKRGRPRTKNVATSNNLSLESFDQFTTKSIPASLSPSKEGSPNKPSTKYLLPNKSSVFCSNQSSAATEKYQAFSMLPETIDTTLPSSQTRHDVQNKSIEASKSFSLVLSKGKKGNSSSHALNFQEPVDPKDCPLNLSLQPKVRVVTQEDFYRTPEFVSVENEGFSESHSLVCDPLSFIRVGHIKTEKNTENTPIFSQSKFHRPCQPTIVTLPSDSAAPLTSTPVDSNALLTQATEHTTSTLSNHNNSSATNKSTYAPSVKQTQDVQKNNVSIGVSDPTNQNSKSCQPPNKFLIRKSSITDYFIRDQPSPLLSKFVNKPEIRSLLKSAQNIYTTASKASSSSSEIVPSSDSSAVAIEKFCKTTNVNSSAAHKRKSLGDYTIRSNNAPEIRAWKQFGDDSDRSSMSRRSLPCFNSASNISSLHDKEHQKNEQKNMAISSHSECTIATENNVLEPTKMLKSTHVAVELLKMNSPENICKLPSETMKMFGLTYEDSIEEI